jgi:hypothetical protein
MAHVYMSCMFKLGKVLSLMIAHKSSRHALSDFESSSSEPSERASASTVSTCKAYMDGKVKTWRSPVASVEVNIFLVFGGHGMLAAVSHPP